MHSPSHSSVLTPLHVFGLAGDIRKGGYFLGETTVLYPAGNSIIIYNNETKLQRFLPISEDADSICCVCVSGNKKLLAVGEKNKKGFNVAMWDLVKFTKKKVLVVSEDPLEVMESLSLCAEGKLLIIQGGKPEWNVYLWNWEKNKMITSMRATTDHSRSITDVNFHPLEPSIVTICGDHILKFFRITDNNFKAVSINFMKREMQVYTCHCWLSDDFLAVGTDTGDILIFEYTTGYELKAVLTCSEPGLSVDCISACSKGLIVGCDRGVINVFEKSDDNVDLFKCSKVFKTPTSDPFTSLQLSPSEDILLCFTFGNQMLVLSLSNSDIVNPDDLSFEYYSSPFHSPGRSGKANVTGLDICIRKPLVATCGLDRTVRVWNYLEKNLDLTKVFEEEALCISFHPTGLQVAVAFNESVQLMNLLMADIRPYKSFDSIKSCSDIKFTSGGHKFAACSYNTIFIHSFYSGSLLHKLSGPMGAVTSLHFSFDDLFIFSSYETGYVCKWNLKNNGKVIASESPIASKQYKNFTWRSVVSSHENNLVVYGVGEYLMSNAALEALKEDMSFTKETTPSHMLMCLEIGNDGLVQSRFEMDMGVKVGACVLSNNGKYLFIATCMENSCGRIKAYKLPLVNNDYTEVICSGSPITRLSTNQDDTLLFANSEDGCFLILNVKQEGRNVKRENLTFGEEILVTKSDLEHKNTAMLKLQSEIEQRTNENEYNLNMKDLAFSEKIKEITEKFKNEVENNRVKYNVLLSERKIMEHEYEGKIKEIESIFKGNIEELDRDQNSKIRQEMERYEALGKERDESNAKWDKQNALLIDSHDAALEEMTLAYEKKLNDELAEREILIGEKNAIANEFLKSTGAIELDVDEEVEDLKAKYMAKLTMEKNLKLRLRGENVIMRKKYTADKKVISNQDEEILEKQQREMSRYENIKSLEKDIIGHMKEIREREDTIADKDKRIYDLKKKNQELEKFKFVLDYKIKELRRQIEPRQNEISDMRSQMKEMDQELEAYHTSNASLDLMIGELKQKMEGMEREYNDQSNLLIVADGLMTTLRDDLNETVTHILDHKSLKHSIVKLYKKFVVEGTATSSNEMDNQKEYNRMREYLEKSVEGLKRKIEKDSLLHQADRARLMRENAKLIIEVNALRRELHSSTASKKDMTTKGKDPVLYNPTFTTSAAPYLTEYEANRELEMQRKEIAKLRLGIQNLTTIAPLPLSKTTSTGGLHYSKQIVSFNNTIN